MITLRYSKLSPSAKRIAVVMSTLGLLAALGFPVYVTAHRPPVESTPFVQQVIAPSRPESSASDPEQAPDGEPQPQQNDDDAPDQSSQEPSRPMTREEILAAARERAAREAGGDSRQQQSEPPERPEESRAPEHPELSQPEPGVVVTYPESSDDSSSQPLDSVPESSPPEQSDAATDEAARQASEAASSQAEADRIAAEEAQRQSDAQRLAAEEAQRQAEAEQAARTFQFNPADYSENKGGYFDKNDGSRTLIANSFPTGTFVSATPGMYNWQGNDHQAIQYLLADGSVVVEILFW